MNRNIKNAELQSETSKAKFLKKTRWEMMLRSSLVLKTLLIVIIIFAASIVAVDKLLITTSPAHADASDSYVTPPSWWNGDCDAGNNPGSHPTYSFRGVEACAGGNGHYSTFGGVWPHGIQEWQCVELADRYLKVVYGINPFSLPSGDAKYLVSSFPTNGYPNNQFQKFTNNTSQAQHNAPQPGDIISYDNPNNPNDPGHVVVVTYSNVDPGTGTGYITVMQQNANGNFGGPGYLNENVKGWVVQNLYSNRQAVNWLHDPTSNSPSVIKNQYNELEAFARDQDGFIEHAWQQGPGGGWTNWSLINGGSMNRFLSDPAAALNGNYIEMFAIGTDHNLYNTWQNPDGSWVNWNKWTGGTVLVGNPVVAKDNQGRLNVFVRQDNGVLWQNSKQCVGSCAWNNWYDLTSSDITHNVNGNHHWYIADDPTVTLSNDGRLELFARTMDNSQNVFYVAQSSPGGSWGFWRSLGGYALGKQWVVKNYQGELEVFARASDSSIWHNWENIPGAGANGIDPGANWHGWTQLAPGYENNPMVAMNANGAMEVFVRGTDQHIYHDYQLSPGGGWSGWQVLIGSPYNFYGDPYVAANNDGRLELFARGITNFMYHEWQNSVNGTTDWAPFDGGNLYTIGNVQFR